MENTINKMEEIVDSIIKDLKDAGFELSDDYDQVKEADEDIAGRIPWKARNDFDADWAVRRIAEEKAELDRLTGIAEKQIAAINEKVEAAQRRFESKTGFFRGRLMEYFETVPHRKTKTKASYRLLSGTLTRKFGGQKMEPDDTALIRYLHESGNEDMINVVEKPRWGEFKKRLEVSDGQIVDTLTGEIVDGVSLIEKPDTFVVEV